MTVLISMDGVLRTENGDPIQQGLKLYRTFSATTRVVLSTDGTREEAENFLRNNLITNWGDILSNNSAFEGEDLKIRHLKLLQSQGRVDWLVDPDVDRCKAAIAIGIPALLFTSPKFVRTKRGIKPWSEIQNEIDAQKKLVAKIILDGPLDRWE